MGGFIEPSQASKQELLCQGQIGFELRVWVSCGKLYDSFRSFMCRVYSGRSSSSKSFCQLAASEGLHA